jgi:hypothetical protein
MRDVRCAMGDGRCAMREARGHEIEAIEPLACGDQQLILNDGSMRLLTIAMVAVLAAGRGNPLPQDVERDQDRAAIVQTMLDYAEGYYGGEPARMARAVSPFLSKRAMTVRSGVPPFLLEMNADTLIDAANGAKLPAADRHITTEVLDVTGDVASARVFTAQFNDYLHLVKRNGAWQILNVLWHAPMPGDGAADAAKPAVDAAAREYTAALVAGDGARALAVLHPLARLRVLAAPPQGRPRIVRELNPETLAAALASGQGRLPGTLDDARIAVLGIDTNIASARVTTGSQTTYLHLALFDGKWRVAHTLAYPPAPAGSSAR